jgi:hypothetical protein
MGFRGYWDAHEEEMLRRGVQKHGIGSWERIRHDPEFKVLKCVAWATARRAGGGAGGGRGAGGAWHACIAGGGRGSGGAVRGLHGVPFAVAFVALQA